MTRKVAADLTRLLHCDMQRPQVRNQELLSVDGHAAARLPVKAPLHSTDEGRAKNRRVEFVKM